MASIPTAAYGSKSGAKCGPSFTPAKGAKSTGSDIGPSGETNTGIPSSNPASRAKFVLPPGKARGKVG